MWLLLYLRSGNGVGPILTAPEPTRGRQYMNNWKFYRQQLSSTSIACANISSSPFSTQAELFLSYLHLSQRLFLWYTLYIVLPASEDTIPACSVVSSEIYLNISGNVRKFVNYLCQSAVSKCNIAKWCCKISIFSTNKSPDLYASTSSIMFRKITCFSTASRNISEFEWKL